jgi:hypothetical protein
MSKRSKRRSLALLLPLLLAFAFQATQYARAPVEYDHYVVYGKNADIAVRPGVDLAPNGATLLQNSSTQEGFYVMSLGRWAPGYTVNYTDSHRVVNREAFDIRMLSFNFTDTATGQQYLRVSVQNDTDDDGLGDTWVLVWNGTQSTLSPTNYVYFKATSTYGEDGGWAKVQIDVVIPDNGVGLSNGTPELSYSGRMDYWFTSVIF